jgi:hypothetical protein
VIFAPLLYANRANRTKKKFCVFFRRFFPASEKGKSGGENPDHDGGA